jgi:hypothetical protein
VGYLTTKIYVIANNTTLSSFLYHVPVPLHGDKNVVHPMDSEDISDRTEGCLGICSNCTESIETSLSHQTPRKLQHLPEWESGYMCIVKSDLPYSGPK